MLKFFDGLYRRYKIVVTFIPDNEPKPIKLTATGPLSDFEGGLDEATAHFLELLRHAMGLAELRGSLDVSAKKTIL